MSFYETMPKVELHLHLEGAIPLDALWSLIEQAGGDPGVPTRQDLDDRFAYRDFAHFIERWVWKNRYLSSYEAFTFASEAVARRTIVTLHVDRHGGGLPNRRVLVRDQLRQNHD